MSHMVPLLSKLVHKKIAEKQKKHDEDSAVDDTENIPEYRGFQYFIVCLVGLTFLIMGMHFQWIGPVIKSLRNEKESVLGRSIDPLEEFWLYLSLYIGMVPGALVGYFIAENLGRICILPIISASNILAGIIFIFLDNIMFIYLGRIIAGIAVGITQAIVPIYVDEISSPLKRGFNVACLIVLFGIGSLFSIVTMPFLSFHHSSIPIVAISTILAFAIFFMPESPYFVTTKGKKDSSVENILQLSRGKQDVSRELSEIKETWTTGNDLFRDYAYTRLRSKHLFGFIILLFIAQLNGSLVEILQMRIAIESFMTALMIGCIFIGSAILAMSFLDTVSRRLMFACSCILHALCGIAIGIVASHKEIVAILFIFSTITYTFGIMTMPYLFAGELFDTQQRCIAGLSIPLSSSITSTIMLIIYKILYHKDIGRYLFWSIAPVSIVGSVLVIFLLPNTRQKSLDQIQNEFARKLTARTRT